MDVTFVANDTRGGIEPYLVLARVTAERGHTVRVVAPPQYETDVLLFGARFAPLRGAEHAQAIASSGRISLREMSRRVVQLTGMWATETVPQLDGTDLVVSGIGGMALARPLAEAVGAPLLRAHLQPLEAPSSEYPGALASRLTALGPAGRRFSHTVTSAGASLLTRAPERSARTALGLRGPGRAAVPTIAYGFSGAVVPVRSDQRVTRTATGYWTLPAPTEADSRLREFVGRPGPVISIGFGSMTDTDPRTLRRLALTAARRNGARIVLLTGWGALAESQEEDEDVFTTASVAHSWLFPRVSATVHHGGAGTTGAALSAGRPTVIVPFGADQPFWAARAHELGASPPPIPRARLRETLLADAIHRALNDSDIERRAHDLGETLHRDRGAQAAVDIIETAAQGG